MVGDDGQAALAEATVLVAGCGALGTVAADLLCRAGVGTLVLVDRDVVEPSNLQRQTLYTERDASRRTPKAEAARLRLGQVDGRTRLRAFVEDIAPDTVEELATGCDLLLDGLDNFETRYLLNDVSVKHGLPYLYGGAVGTGGTTMPVLPRSPVQSGRIRWTSDQSTPCLRCVFPTPPAPGVMPTCDTAGVLGTVTATVAAHLATEAIKLLVGRIDDIDRTLRQVDLWRNEHRALDLRDAFDPDCPCCGRRSFEHLDASHDGATMLCGRNAVQVRGNGDDVDLDRILARLAPMGRFEAVGGVVRGVLENERSPTDDPVELVVFADGRTLVVGGTDVAWARGVHSRLLGG